MNLKILFAVVLIIVIAGLFVLLPTGKPLIGNIDISLPGLAALINLGSKDYFQMQLVANKEAFTGKTFDLGNTSIQVSGLCAGFVNIYGANIQKDARCTISADQVRGKLEYSTIGTIDVNIEASYVNMDGSIIVPGNDRRVRFSVIPSDLYIANYNPLLVSLPSVTGELKKFKADGTDDQTKVLNSEKVEITSYIGNVRLSFNNIVLSGFATKVNWFS